MSLKTQAKVLRVLQEQVMERVGGTQRIRVDVRVLAATNKDLPAEIRAGRFREDLYFRLNVIPIFVPPLRDRAEDIPLLADHFMAMMAAEYGRRPKRLAPEAVARLQQYSWPGNVRELRNVHRAADDHGAGRHHHRARHGLPGHRRRDAVRAGRPPATGAAEARDQFERDYILRALAARRATCRAPPTPTC
jgi:two-component system, NtrC family, nitrogen regulation response regulator NtrX